MATGNRARAAKTTEKETAAPAATVTLQNIIDATKSEAGFLYTSAAVHNPLIATGDVELNPAMVNEAGKIATRATAKHLGNTVTDTATQTATTAAKAKPIFDILDDEPIPERKKREFTAGNRAGRQAIYPFDELKEGQAFFVPNKGDKSAYKALASTVNGANAKYAEEIQGVTRVMTRGKNKGQSVPATRQKRYFKAFDSERTVLIDGVETVQKGAKVFRMKPEDFPKDGSSKTGEAA